MTKKYQKFYELDIWQRAYKLQKEVFELTQTYSKDERFGLISQTNNSSNSVVANIAESHGRFYYADKIRVLYIARGEIEETQSHLFVAYSRNYVQSKEVNHLVGEYEKLKIGVNNYISDFSNKKDKDK